MRIWLVDDRSGHGGVSLAQSLRQLEEQSGSELRLVGTSSFQTDFVALMRKLAPDLPDLIVINEAVWPAEAWTEELLGLGPGFVVVAPRERLGPLRSLSERYPLWFVPPQSTVEALWLVLLGAWASQRRQLELRAQLDRLQQRLSDRIVIERAKGILVQQLGISEEEAYKRLRLSSRRQRRPIRDIAQSLVDAQLLLLPDLNGCPAPRDSHGQGTDPTPAAARFVHDNA